MQAKASRRTDATNVVGAGAAGGGIGTVLAAIANNLPIDSPWKSTLSLSAPLVSIGISGLWLFIKAVYVDPFANGRRHRAADAAMEKILADARANADRIQNDPQASDTHKREVRKIVEDLEKLRMRKITERMNIVASV
jgi:hypothetical protein